MSGHSLTPVILYVMNKAHPGINLGNAAGLLAWWLAFVSILVAQSVDD